MSSYPFSSYNVGKGVKSLLIANGIIFVLQKFLPGQLELFFGLIPLKVVSEFQLWRLVTYSFLHGSFFHILFNMLTLWMFGKEIENAWGTKEFLKFYFLCVLGAAFMNTLVQPFSILPIIGASGAIYGLLVAFAFVYPEAIIYFYGLFPLAARQFDILMAVFEFFASFDGISGGIARIAHLGGMATGYFYMKSYEFRSFWFNLYHRILDSLIVRKPQIKIKKKNIKIRMENLTQEVDRILEKVLLQGAGSLTEEEREVMRRYSAMKH